MANMLKAVVSSILGKYKLTIINGEPRIVNRETAETIPIDEPVFVGRATDVYMGQFIEEYADDLLRLYVPAGDLIKTITNKRSDPYYVELKRRAMDFFTWQMENRDKVKDPRITAMIRKGLIEDPEIIAEGKRKAAEEDARLKAEEEAERTDAVKPTPDAN